MQDQNLGPHGFQEPPSLKELDEMRLLGGIEVAEARTAHQGAQDKKEKGKGEEIKNAADGPEAHHEAAQGCPAPISGPPCVVKGMALVCLAFLS